MAECLAKHTAFQPTDDQWRCPQCGAGNDNFYIEEPASGRDDNCEKVHENDEIYCHKCNYAASGKSLTKKLMTKYDCKTCPTCKGRGTVPNA